MDFNKDYPILVEKAKSFVKHFEIEAEPSEVVSSVYLKLFSNPEYKYDYFIFEKEIIIHCQYFNSNTPNFIPYVDKWKKSQQHFDFKGQRVCTKCKKTKTVSEFGVKTNSIGKKSQRNTCKDCYNEWRRGYRKNNRGKDKQQKINRREAAPELIKSQRKTISKRIIHDLDDTYIRDILLKKYSRDFIKTHPEIFEETRDRILKKRLTKKIKQIKEYKKIQKIGVKVATKLNHNAFGTYEQFKIKCAQAGKKINKLSVTV